MEKLTITDNSGCQVMTTFHNKHNKKSRKINFLQTRHLFIWNDWFLTVLTNSSRSFSCSSCGDNWLDCNKHNTDHSFNMYISETKLFLHTILANKYKYLFYLSYLNFVCTIFLPLSLWCNHHKNCEFESHSW